MTRVVEDIGSRNLANMAVTEVGACDVSRGRVKLKVYEVLAEVFSCWTRGNFGFTDSFAILYWLQFLARFVRKNSFQLTPCKRFCLY